MVNGDDGSLLLPLPEDTPLMTVCSYHLLRAAFNTYSRSSPVCAAALSRKYSGALAKILLNCCGAGLLPSVAHSRALSMLASMELQTGAGYSFASLTTPVEIAARAVVPEAICQVTGDAVDALPSRTGCKAALQAVLDSGLPSVAVNWLKAGHDGSGGAARANDTSPTTFQVAAPPDVMETILLDVWVKVAAQKLCCAVLAAADEDTASDTTNADADEVTKLLHMLNLGMFELPDFDHRKAAGLAQHCISLVKRRLQHVTNQQGAAVFSDAALARAVRHTPAALKLLDGPSNTQLAQLTERMLHLMRKGPAAVSSVSAPTGKQSSEVPYQWYEAEMMRLGMRFGCSNPLCLEGTRPDVRQMQLCMVLQQGMPDGVVA